MAAAIPRESSSAGERNTVEKNSKVLQIANFEIGSSEAATIPSAVLVMS